MRARTHVCAHARMYARTHGFDRCGVRGGEDLRSALVGTNSLGAALHCDRSIACWTRHKMTRPRLRRGRGSREGLWHGWLPLVSPAGPRASAEARKARGVPPGLASAPTAPGCSRRYQAATVFAAQCRSQRCAELVFRCAHAQLSTAESCARLAASQLEPAGWCAHSVVSPRSKRWRRVVLIQSC